MTLLESRRRFLALLGTSAGCLVLTACGSDGGSTAAAGASGSSQSTPPPATPPPDPPPPPPPDPNAALKSFLRSNAVSGLALPPATTAVPHIDWAGPLDSNATPATTLPDGIIYPLTDSRFSVPISNQYSASLAGNPSIAGYPCLAAFRDYTCKGMARSVGSTQTLRLKTDAPVIELSGAIADGNGVVQTLIVDGSLVPAKVLTCSRGNGGGWDAATIRIDFGSRQMRDVWIESAMYITYVKLDQADALVAVADADDPQMTVVGDSYLQVRSANFGNGAAIALSLGARLGIRKIATDSIGGTGYWNSGGDLGNLNDRLAGHAADGSDIYLVMSGLNDYQDITGGQGVWPSTAQWEGAVKDYLAGLRAAQPKALIVVCAPFCPIPPMSDSSSVANASTNVSGMGDFLYKAALFKSATMALAGPWIYIDVLMGTGWLNSSGASGDVTGLQWLTGGTPGTGTTATNKPGNTHGGGGGGFGGIASVPVLTAGRYSQAPNVLATGGSGTGLMLWANIDQAGNLTQIEVQVPGAGYTAGIGLPAVTIDPTFELSPTILGDPTLIVGTNPDGQYPLPAFAPSGVTPDQLNNIYTLLGADLTHPSPVGAEYLAQRLAQNIYEAIAAL